MTVHLIKLCVGVSEPEELEVWQARRVAEKKAAGIPPEVLHITRMVPKRAEELLDGGSLFWVMKGEIRARQTLLDVRDFRDDEGIRRCALVLDPEVVRTQRRGRRPFQGWRYLKTEDAPSDVRLGADEAEMPEEMRAELEKLGLL
ncbi:MAG: DUF1489 domain-containing protein [Parvibaculaceae bacterium]|nr:DUF1489 domain-containing protein [Parvibaculaceae bacterium]